MEKQQYLTKNQQIVLDFVEKSSEPLKAYSILFNVQKKGLKAPLQVYRALDKLVEQQYQDLNLGCLLHYKRKQHQDISLRQT